jgi:hypothetical protein
VQVSSLRAAVKKSDVGELRDGMAELKSRVKSLEERLKVAGERRARQDLRIFGESQRMLVKFIRRFSSLILVVVAEGQIESKANEIDMADIRTRAVDASEAASQMQVR